MITETLTEIIGYLPFSLKQKLAFLPEDTCEIRIRKNCPLAIMTKDKTLFLNQNGSFSEFITGSEKIISKTDIKECFLNLCNRSVFAHEEEIKNGFISLKNGCRVGVFCNLNGDALGEINSLNIRVAREVKGCAENLKNDFSGGLLIAGPPSSGKTTVLRELIRFLSSGETGKFYKVSVIDSRMELKIGDCSGITADIIQIKDKAKGCEIALRTMSPDIIAFDEIGTVAELKSVGDCLNAGVTVITTAHIGCINELKKREVTRKLLLSGAIKKVAVLSKNIGQKPIVLETENILNEY